MLQSIKKTANGLVALFKDGTSYNPLLGRTNGIAVPSGYIGETISRNPGTGTNAGSSSAYSNIFGSGNGITLTPGKWSISCHAICYSGATTAISSSSNMMLIISTNETNDSSGVDNNAGSDRDVIGIHTGFTPTSGLAFVSLKVIDLVVNITATTNYYAKGEVQYTSSVPQWYGKLQATRIA